MVLANNFQAFQFPFHFDWLTVRFSFNFVGLNAIFNFVGLKCYVLKYSAFHWNCNEMLIFVQNFDYRFQKFQRKTYSTFFEIFIRRSYFELSPVIWNGCLFINRYWSCIIFGFKWTMFYWINRRSCCMFHFSSLFFSSIQ